MTDELKPVHKHPLVGGAARAAKLLRAKINAALPEYRFDDGDTLGVGDFVVGGWPDTLEDISYGMYPMRMPEMSNIPNVTGSGRDMVSNALAQIGVLNPAFKYIGKPVAKWLAREWKEAPVRAAVESVPKFAGGGWLSKLAKRVGRGAEREAIERGGSKGPLTAVKEQGGQWWPGSAQEFTEDIFDNGVGEYKPHEEWGKKAFPKYIEKYLGAKGDPLADMRVPHGPGAARWEDLADLVVKSHPASVLSHDPHAPPWMKQLPPDTPIYSPSPARRSASSIRDYMSHLLDHASTIPPDRLKNYDLPRLAREVQARDAERAKKMATAEGRLEGTVPFKQYPSGFQWVEVQSPEALKNEGDVMGHCVGDYCEAVKSGKTKIYSLRDPQGQAHATIEQAPSQKPPFDWYYQTAPKEFTQRYPLRGRGGNPSARRHLEQQIEQSPEFQAYRKSLPPSIQQIKGKQNLAPKEQYLPYVQDFVMCGTCITRACGILQVSLALKMK